MIHLTLKPFQKKAVEKLSDTFLDLWQTGNYKIPLVFKAPTGAGKTIMMADFLRCLDDNHHFHADKAYLWISFSEDSYQQSKKKFYTYFNEGTDRQLKDLQNLNEEKLFKNNIFFINWQKIKGTTKGSPLLRRDTEYTEGEGVFDEYIKATRKERDLVLIIDEAHTQTETQLADEIIELIHPRLILKVTATPKVLPNISDVNQKKAGFVEVLEEEVVESGLIKEKIIIQKEEEIKTVKEQGINEDEMMIELAYRRREELKKIYEQLNLNINPLVLIQLPSDEKETKTVVQSKRDVVLSYLRNRKKVSPDKIAIWLSNEKENREGLERNDNKVEFMLFKVAPATGWDCPRADVLVMFREIKNPSFHTQILGRIKRMPEGKHYKKAELNKAYVYTNYNKSHLDTLDTKDRNQLPIHFTELKKDIAPIKIESTFHRRTDFNTLGPSNLWQKSCLKTFHDYFGTSDEIMQQNKNYKKLSKKIVLKHKAIPNKIIIDSEIESFDNFVSRLKENAKETEYQLSNLDVQKLYNLLCFRELKNQENDRAKYNPSRSWGPLKEALNVYFINRVGLDIWDAYKVIVRELLNANSELKKAVCQALINFRKDYELEVQKKQKEEKNPLFIPEKEKCFTAEYEKCEKIELNKNLFNQNEVCIIDITKNVYRDFYLKKKYSGRDNEENFIHFLENQAIDWWHKQEDSGRHQFAISYFHKEENKDKLFYPDWIIKKGNTFFILDTKAGFTLSSPDTKHKAESLQKWIAEKANEYDFKIIGGIIKSEYPSWKINQQKEYDFASSSNWENLEFSS